MYCPQFTNNDFLYGGFYTYRFSWTRLALHFCDNSSEAIQQRIQEGKKHIECKSEEEIKIYFTKTIISLDLLSHSVNLGSHEDHNHDDPGGPVESDGHQHHADEKSLIDEMISKELYSTHYSNLITDSVHYK